MGSSLLLAASCGTDLLLDLTEGDVLGQDASAHDAPIEAAGGYTEDDGALETGPICTNCASCTSDLDCARNSTEVFCDKTTYLCVACRSDKDCPSTDICDPEVKKCSRLCTSNAMCAGDCLLDGGIDGGYCVECLTDSECTDPAYPRCDHQCFQCLDDADCAASQAGPFCWTQRHRCVECLQDSDCSGVNVTCTTGQHLCRQL
jgi:hypothetical protein